MTGIGASYGQALYSLAKEEGLAADILSQLEILQESFAAEPDFLRLLSAPGLSKDERCGMVDRCFREKVHPYVLNFLKILTGKGYARSFGDCCKVFREQYNTDNGILSVLAVTAVALRDDQHEKLRSKLEQVTGKTVILQNRVDASCIGGVRLDYDGKRVDGTVQNRLDSLRKKLENTVL